MKKILLPLFLCAASVLSAQEIFVNGAFKGSALNSPIPKGWIKAGHKDPQIGKSAVIKLADGKLALQCKTEKKATAFYTMSKAPFGAGDKVTISLQASGSGKFRVYYYGYNGISNFINGGSPVMVLTKDMKTYTATLVGQNKIMKNKSVRKLEAIRIAIEIFPGTDAAITDLKAMIQKKAAAPVKK